MRGRYIRTSPREKCGGKQFVCPHVTIFKFNNFKLMPLSKIKLADLPGNIDDAGTVRSILSGYTDEIKLSADDFFEKEGSGKNAKETVKTIELPGGRTVVGCTKMLNELPRRVAADSKLAERLKKGEKPDKILCGVLTATTPYQDRPAGRPIGFQAVTA